MNRQDFGPRVVFLCDGKRECNRSPFCYVNCAGNPDACRHTTTRRHAKYGYERDLEDGSFEKIRYQVNTYTYIEKEVTK